VDLRPRRRPLAKPLLLSLTALVVAGVGWWTYTRTSVPYRLKALRAQLSAQSELGDTAQVAATLEQILALDPSDQQVALQLVQLYPRLHRLRDAEALLRRYLEWFPDSLRFRHALASQLADEGRVGEAAALILARLEQIEAHPDVGDRATGMILAGRLLARRGQPAEGLALIERATLLRETYGLRAQDAGDDRAAGLLAQAEVLELMEQPKGALRALAAAVGLAPDGLQARLRLGRLLAKSGDVPQAQTTLLEFYEDGSSRAGEVLPALAWILVEADELERAQELARRLDEDGALGAAAFTRGLIADRVGDLPAARAAFDRMILAHPASVEARLQLARVAGRQGDLAGAREALEEALLLDREDLRAGQALLSLDEQAGDWEAAGDRALRLLEPPRSRRRAMRTVLQLGARGDTEVVQSALAWLDAISDRSPHDMSVRLYATLLRLATGDRELASAELTAMAADDRLDLDAALGLLAPAPGREAEARPLLELLAGLSDQHPQLAAIGLLLARVQLRLGHPEAAGKTLDRTLAARPDWRPARLARIRLALAQGEDARAARELESLREREPDDLEAIEALADVRLGQGKHARAIHLLERACELQPRSGRALARLAHAQALAGRLRPALTTFEDAQRVSPREPLVYQDGAVFLILDDAAMAETALRIASRLTQEAAYGAAWAAALLMVDEPEAALPPLRRWLTGRRSPSGLLVLSLARARAGDSAGAEQARKLAVDAGAPPEVAAAALVADASSTRWLLRTFALTALGWVPGVPGWFDAIDAGQTRDPLQLWWALQVLPSPAARLRLARRLAASAPGAGTGLLLARAQARAGYAAERVSTLRELSGRHPDDSQVLLELCMALEADGAAEEALELYERLVTQHDAPSPLAQNNLAWLLARAPDRRRQAIQHARAAAQATPGLAATQDTLGWLLLLEGHLAESIAHLRQAVTLAPSRATYRHHLAQALEAAGEHAAARAQLEAALLARDALDDPASADSLLARLDDTQGATRERPDETAHAPRLGPGATLTGELDALADRDLVSLELTGSPRDLELSASPSAPLWVELLALRAGVERTLRVVPVQPGAGVTLRGLVARTQASTLLRVSAATPAATAEGGAGPSPPTEPARWRATLSPSRTETGDHEPNDGAADALSLGATPARGVLDASDPSDWYRLSASAGQVWSLRLSPRGDAHLAMEIWERSAPGGDLRLRGVLEPGQAGQVVVAPRWRPPAGREWFVAVRAVSLSGPAGYALEVRQATNAPHRETEPNDEPAAAEAPLAGQAWEGTLGSSLDVDWLQLAGGLHRLEWSGPPSVLRLFEGPPERPALLLEIRCDEGGLTLPALQCPDEGGLLSIEGVAASGSYSLTLRAVEPSPGLEVEPNQDPAQATRLRTDTPLRGSLSGADPRDLLLLPSGARTVRVTASTGGLQVRLLGAEGAEAQRVEPGDPWTQSGPLGGHLLEIRRDPEAPPARSWSYSVETEGP
jgi:tetratricopeptide (TPR) repeat protein